VLEESLRGFPGAIVLITHDRFLLDRLSDILLYFDSNGEAEFFADYHQWLEAKKSQLSTEVSSGGVPKSEKKTSQRLSYEERKELNRIEQKIAKAEQVVDTLRQQLHDPEIMSDSERLAKLYAQLQEAENNAEQIYQRWEELELLNKSN
jgi:ATP-binding cassette subfamily F protein uup